MLLLRGPKELGRDRPLARSSSGVARAFPGASAPGTMRGLRVFRLPEDVSRLPSNQIETAMPLSSGAVAARMAASERFRRLSVPRRKRAPRTSCDRRVRCLHSRRENSERRTEAPYLVYYGIQVLIAVEREKREPEPLDRNSRFRSDVLSRLEQPLGNRRSCGPIAL